MESSFFEYRDKSVVEVESDSDTDIIEESILEELMPKTPMKTPMRKNQTIVPDSEESLVYDGSEDENNTPYVPKTLIRRSITANNVIGSSDDDGSMQSSRQSQNMPASDVADSSDEEEVSPELVPKRRPPTRPKSLDTTTDSPIIRRVKKRMVLLDSDTDNSVILEKDGKTKMKCLKDTPLKIDGGRDGKLNDSEESSDEAMDHDASQNATIDDEGSDVNHEATDDNDESKDDYDKNYCDAANVDVHTDNVGPDPGKDNNDEDNDKCDAKNRCVDTDHDGPDHSKEDNDEDNIKKDDDETDDDGPDEDQMAMSRATRMSIMGIIPKQNDSDESDFIESDESGKSSIGGSTASLPSIHSTARSVPLAESTRRTTGFHLTVDGTESDTDLPAVNVTLRTPLKVKTPGVPLSPVKYLEEEYLDGTNDDSVLSCSPIQSPSRDDSPKKNTQKTIEEKALKEKVLNYFIANEEAEKTNTSEVTVIEDGFIKPKNTRVPKQKSSYYDGEVTVVEDAFKEAKEVKGVKDVKEANKENSMAYEDQEVTVIESVPEVIMLSSDDEGEINAPVKTTIKTSPKVKKNSTLKQFLPPPSYPNQVKYVQKHVLDNELNKLNYMQADLQNIRHLLDNMDITTLPDRGSKLISRLTELEAAVRRQGDLVGNMVVEPSQPTPGDIARDGFGGLSWDDLKKASNAVQPKMFGKQAMSTHLAERNLILERLRDLHSALDSRPDEEKQAPAPAAMKTELMPHQKHALAWLRWREALNPHGGILADDMGLGKTITMISLIAGDREIAGDDESDDDEDRPKGKLTKGGTLVVCPASLMTQWEGEVKKHCLPHRVTTVLHHGASRATQPQRLAHTDIVLTTYNILQRDSEKNGVLMRISWRRVILDEAHSVRNHKSATSRAVCALRARRRWALTGTPLHNKDLDLFALLKFIRCTPFDDLMMWKKWIDNKSQGGQERLSTIMRCIMLRRTKAQLQAKGQLKDLPERTAHQCHVTLTKEEMNVYQKVLVFSKTLFAQFLHQRAERDADGGPAPALASRPNKDSAYYEMHKRMIALQGAKPVKAHEILVLLLRLRQVCCHCGLIAAMLDGDDTADLAEDEGGKDLLAELNKLTLEESKDDVKDTSGAPREEGTTAAEAIRSVLSPNNPVFQLTRQSSKIRAVMDCLRNNVLKKKGEKAVVVSQWTSVLSLVEAELKQERVRSVTLSGSVPVPARAALVNALNDPKSDVRIMLLSLCAGGVGLNLCGASHLLLLDPHWNPQLEEQAQDRVYRVGQTRPVHIYRFMCLDTVEQSIRKLQDAKLEMAANVLTGARHTSASKLSIEDLKVLFHMGQ